MLDFIDEPMRSYCAGRLDLATAMAWREFKDYYDAHDLWTNLGLTYNPVGWIVRRIKDGDPPPPIQMPLPGGSFDVEPAYLSRGKTREEIEQQHPLARLGGRLNPDGTWS